MNLKQFFLGLLLAAVLGGFIAVGAYRLFFPHRTYESFEQIQNVRFSSYLRDSAFTVPEGLNFVYAAERIRPTVVHIKTRLSIPSTPAQGEEGGEDPFKDFHSSPFHNPSPRESAGSGVIISPDGYIVTNNHVIEKAKWIEVILDDKRTYIGSIIGADPTTDLALIKIEEEDLPFAPYGDSDRLKIGEWVLAIGNPFDLTSTVTAGIVSAKGRNINILRTEDNMQVESFIQTDAAVNPGNSGGALVNLKGELIGINTAIATQSGVSQGYSFAVPVSLARKVMEDLLKFGTVQRALLGVRIDDINAQLAQDKEIEDIKGVYVQDVNDNSAASEAGLKSGDVITKINDRDVNSTSELQSYVATFHPGDKINITYSRRGTINTIPAVLKNSEGKAALVKRIETVSYNIFGAQLQPVSGQDRIRHHIRGGIKIIKLGTGKFKDAGLKEGFVITHLNYKAIRTVEEVVKIIKDGRTATLVEGFYTDGTKGYRAIAP